MLKAAHFLYDRQIPMISSYGNAKTTFTPPVLPMGLLQQAVQKREVLDFDFLECSSGLDISRQVGYENVGMGILAERAKDRDRRS